MDKTEGTTASDCLDAEDRLQPDPEKQSFQRQKECLWAKDLTQSWAEGTTVFRGLAQAR